MAETLYLVRHAQARHNRTHLSQHSHVTTLPADLDIPLSYQGHGDVLKLNQNGLLAAQMKNVGFIYSSAAQRAWRSLPAIVTPHTPYVVTNLAVEWYPYDVTKEITVQDRHAKGEAARKLNSAYETVDDGGESFAACIDRCDRLLQMIKENEDNAVAVLTHGTLISMLSLRAQQPNASRNDLLRLQRDTAAIGHLDIVCIDFSAAVPHITHAMHHDHYNTVHDYPATHAQAAAYMPYYKNRIQAA